MAWGDGNAAHMEISQMNREQWLCQKKDVGKLG
jgi:hypothetical protein